MGCERGFASRFSSSGGNPSTRGVGRNLFFPATGSQDPALPLRKPPAGPGACAEALYGNDQVRGLRPPHLALTDFSLD